MVEAPAKSYAVPVEIPVDLMIRLREWQTGGKYGNITLDYKDGKIVGWKVSQTERPTTSGSEALTPPQDTS